jgi:hypothetical protein
MSDDGNVATAALSTSLTSPASVSSSSSAAAAAVAKVTLFYKSFSKAWGLRFPHNLIFNW